MPTDHDVIVVGAGFAGVTAARECASRGLRTLVLEGRDRIGGRTWSSRLENGEVAELGGTYVHWLQPHTWSEISRYALEGDVVPGGEELEWALVPRGDALGWIPAADFGAREKALFERVFAPSATALPLPYDPLAVRERIAPLDGLTIRERIDALELDPDDAAYLLTRFGTETGDAEGNGSYLGLMRWWAPAGHHYESMEAAVFGFKLKRGIVTLAEAILADGGAELRLETHVTRVETQGDRVTVTTSDGDEHSAAAVVMATPTGVWPHVEFAPPLSQERTAAVSEGLQVRRSAKAIAVLKGEPRRFVVSPHSGHPIGAMWTSHKRSDDEQVVVVFGSPTLRDAHDHAEVADAIRDLLPHVEVTEVVSGTYYEDDPNVRGGWSMLKPGQLTRLVPHETLAQPEGRVLFATSDIAKLWTGFVDGAIESGIRAGQAARALALAGKSGPDGR